MKKYPKGVKKINLGRAMEEIDARLGKSDVEEYKTIYGFFKGEVKPTIAYIETEKDKRERVEYKKSVVEGNWKKFMPDEATIKLKMSYPYSDNELYLSPSLELDIFHMDVGKGYLKLDARYERDLIIEPPFLWEAKAVGKDAYKKLIDIADGFYKTLELYKSKK